MKRVIAALLVLVACAPGPVNDTYSLDTSGGDTIGLYESSGSTGGSESDDGSDDGSFIDRPDAGDPLGEDELGWHGLECFTLDNTEFVSCQSWCVEQGFQSCLLIETFQDCDPRGEGTQVVGWCEKNPFDEWPDPQDLQIRCVCDGGE